MDADSEILTFFKAAANLERLKILGLLALEPQPIERIAEQLHLKPALVTRHMDHLLAAHLVFFEGRTFRLDSATIENLARENLSKLRPRTSMDDFEGEDYDRKVLKDFLTPEGKIRSIPAQQKKTLAILRHVIKPFEVGAVYTEKQVNEILKRFYEDSTTLRRYLVDNHLLERDPQGLKYWLPEGDT